MTIVHDRLYSPQPEDARQFTILVLPVITRSWAPTAAANYQQYVTGLGTAEVNYATSNDGQFVNEIGLSNTNADPQQTLEKAQADAGDEVGYAKADQVYQDAIRANYAALLQSQAADIFLPGAPSPAAAALPTTTPRWRSTSRNSRTPLFSKTHSCPNRE